MALIMNIKSKRFTDDKYLPVILKNERVLLSVQILSVNDIFRLLHKTVLANRSFCHKGMELLFLLRFIDWYSRIWDQR